MSARPMIAAFGSIDGQLAVGGMPLERLTARVGSTPYFAYDRRLLTERVELLRATLPSTVKLSYAVKANPMPAILHHLAGLVDGMDVASALEMQTALDTGMPAGRISFAGPGKTEAEIVQAVAAGVTIEMESVMEAQRVIRAGEMLGVRPKAAVRVNPDFQVKGSGMGWAAAHNNSESTPNKCLIFSPTLPLRTWTSWGSTSSPDRRTSMHRSCVRRSVRRSS